MRKSGLHKQVAFIFEGAPGTDSAAAVAAPPADAQCRDAQPVRSLSRPKPAPRNVRIPAASAAPKAAVSAAKRKSQDADAARRQKKMTLLVAVLSVVFVGVMIISLGGVGQSSAAATTRDDLPAAAPASKFDPESWVFPDPLPAQMRNPLVIPKPMLMPMGADDIAQSADFAVRGIVYSDIRPTAIIGDQVVVEGQTLYGVTVVKISRDTVELEKDGQRWTQRVQ